MAQDQLWSVLCLGRWHLCAIFRSRRGRHPPPPTLSSGDECLQSAPTPVLPRPLPTVPRGLSDPPQNSNRPGRHNLYIVAVFPFYYNACGRVSSLNTFIMEHFNIRLAPQISMPTMSDTDSLVWQVVSHTYGGGRQKEGLEPERFVSWVRKKSRFLWSTTDCSRDLNQLSSEIK